MIDLFIIIVAAWALLSGWRNGLVKEIASSVGFLAGLFIAATCYSSFGKYLAVDGSEGNMLTSLVAFVILWIITPIALGLAANILTKICKTIHLGGINSLAGAAVSLLKFTILLSCVLSAMSALHILDEERVAGSRLFTPVKGVVSGIVDYALADDGESTRHFTPADRAASAADNDTVWIDMNQPDN